jgi:hypothetical protein
MKKIIAILLILVAGMAILVSCKKYKDEFYGPGLGVAPDDFTATDLVVSNTSPDFLSETIYFQSEFSATVRWTLTLKGQTSGAVGTIKGLSNKISSDNSNWNCTIDTSTVKLFQKDETVVATVTVLGWKESKSVSFTIEETRDRGVLLANFENISVNQTSMNFQDVTSGRWWFFSFETGEQDFVDRIDKAIDPDIPEGNHALKMVGHDVNSSYYIGQAGTNAAPSVFNVGTASANDLYFNIYVKGSGTGADKDYKLVIQVDEDDNLNGSIDYGAKDEDKYSHQISLNYDGWKLHSVKYSDFIFSPSNNASLYKSHSPDKMGVIGLFFGANTSAGLSATQQITVELDHFSTTVGGPMIP